MRSCHFGPQVWKPPPAISFREGEFQGLPQLSSSSSAPSPSRFNDTTIVFRGGAFNRTGAEFQKLSQTVSMFQLGGPPLRHSAVAQNSLKEDFYKPSSTSNVKVLQKSLKRTGQSQKRSVVAARPLELDDLELLPDHQFRPRQNRRLSFLDIVNTPSNDVKSPLRDAGHATSSSSQNQTNLRRLYYKRTGSLEKTRFHQGLPSVSPAPQRQRSNIRITRQATLASLSRQSVPTDGLRTPQEILQRWSASLEGFSDAELLRMKKAFNCFKPADSSEIEASDLVNVMIQLSYIGVTREAVDVIVREMSEYSALTFLEFVTFVERYTRREQDEIKEAFDRNVNPATRQVEARSLFRLVDELGFTTTHLAISESLKSSGLAGSLDLQDLAAFLAFLRATEGFTEKECIDAREVFDTVAPNPSGKNTQPEMPFSSLSSAVAQLFGSRAHEECQQLLRRVLGPVAARDGYHDVSCAFSQRSIDFGDFLVWARRTRILELQMLLKAFNQADVHGLGVASAGDVIRCLPVFGSVLLPGQLRGLLSEVTSNEENLSFHDFQRFYSHCCECEGFTQAEVAELSAVFRKFDTDNSGQIEVLELMDVLFDMGYSTSLEAVHRLIKVIDKDGSGELDFKEFLALMQLHRQEELKAVQSAFFKYSQNVVAVTSVTSKPSAFTDGAVTRSLHRTSCPSVLRELFYFPGSNQVQTILQKIGDPEDLTFERFYMVASLSRQVHGAEMRRNAGFQQKHIELLAEMYKECGGSQDQGIDGYGLTRMLNQLDIQIKSHQDRDELMAAVPAARESAKAAGLSQQEVGVDGDLNIKFMTLLHLLRLSTKRSQRRIITREIKAMEEVGLSNEEVAEFREVFNNMLTNKRSRAEGDENAQIEDLPTGKRQLLSAALLKKSRTLVGKGLALDHTLAELKAFLCVNGRGPLIEVDDVILLLRSLGIKPVASQKSQLIEKAAELATLVVEGDVSTNIEAASSTKELDFAAFLLLLRWLLDSNFADINSYAAGSLRR